MIRCGTAFDMFSECILTTLQPMPRAELIAKIN
jgi:hypothetical protein